MTAIYWECALSYETHDTTIDDIVGIPTVYKYSENALFNSADINMHLPVYFS